MGKFPNTEKAAQEYGFGGRFKFQEGDTRVRVLASALEPIATHFLPSNKPAICIGVRNGCPYHGNGAIFDKEGKEKKASIKYPMYLLLRDIESITYAEVPYSIVKALTDLKNNTDWSFDELPMKYDIIVKYNSNASPAEMYKVMPSPSGQPIPQSILDELTTKKDLDEIVKDLKVKQVEKTELVPLEESKPMTKKEEEEIIQLGEEDEIDVKDLPF